MLDLLRRGVRSWVAKVLLGLLVASFAVWGIGDIGGGFSTRVATVGDQAIEANLYARVMRNEQQRYGIDPADLRASGLDRFVLARMVREAALADAASRLGVSAPDEAIAREARQQPAFQVAGAFDAAQYQATVTRAYPSVGAYEQTVRETLAAAQIIGAAQAGATAPAPMTDAILRLREESRRFDAITLRRDALGLAPPEPDDAALQAHLDANAEAFEAPERRDVTWISIEPAALAGDIPESDLRAAYDAQLSRFSEPATRAIDQIVYDTSAEAEAAAERVRSGAADFDALLAEKRLTRADAALGPVRRDDLFDARGEAAFALEAPGVAGPAQTAGGFALLDVTRITPEDVTPFEAARSLLAEEIAAERGRPEADRMAEEVADLAAGGATLEEISAELGLPLGGDASLQAAGAPADLPGGPEGARALREEAFAASVGEERDLVRLPSGGYVLVRVNAVKPAVTPPLEAIRDAVAADWRRAWAVDALGEAAEAARARIAGGETLEGVADDLGLAIEPLGPMRRDDPDPRLGEDARAALFAAQPGAAAVSVAGASATVAVLREIIPPSDPAAREALARTLAASLAADQVDYLGRALEAEAGVSINQQALDAALAQIGA
ncbi:peptidylprolyl isomerase [Rubrimonas cliftonensis]|uniref:Parvulin-like PPIase n=1 Tax=Rubrimonas cliftonensis TaxID=89524 RepID=A0A1H4CKW6_9RHOB|nr:peptidylprolyl isomerase [Rubrimonas cliftonensis]SEA61086.1 peptidyl-prolyl cis-trans isomerase D [Rubrimonas cliftonensis]